MVGRRCVHDTAPVRHGHIHSPCWVTTENAGQSVGREVQGQGGVWDLGYQGFEFKLNSYPTKLVLLKGTVKWVSCSPSCASTTTVNFRTFSSPRREALHPLAVTARATLPPALDTCPPAFRLRTCLFWTLHLNGILSYGAFYVWFLTLSMRWSGFIRTVARIRTLFLFAAKGCSIERIRHILFLGMIS